MAFSVTDITSTISKYNGIHRPSHFLVRITPPTFLGVEGYIRDVEYLCDATNLPGIHFDTTPVKPMGYGTSELRPYDTVFNPIRCDFFVDNKGDFFKFFHKWMGNINNFGRDILKASDSTGLNYYEFAYPKEYEGTIELYLYTAEGSELKTTKLLNAFPIDIGDLGLAWEMNDSISRISVTFAYNTWSTGTLPFNKQARDIGERVTSLRNNLESYTPSGIATSSINGQNPDGSYVGAIGLPSETPVFNMGS